MKRVKKSFGINLKVQLIVGFLIPIIFVLFVGQYAYQKAAKGLIRVYEESTIVAVEKTAELLDLGFESINSDSLQLVTDGTISKYALNIYTGGILEKNSAINSINKTIVTKEVANKFINGIYLITNEANDSLTSYNTKKNEYSALQFETDYAGILNTKGGQAQWIGDHFLLDEATNIPSDEYICTNVRKIDGGKAYILIDVSKEKISEILSSLQVGEGSIVSFVTKEGREISNKEDFTFFDKEYFQESMEGGEKSSSEYVTYDGRKYLFMYAKCDTNDAVICALVPESIITAEAVSMKNTIYLFVLVSSIIVFVIGAIIILGISRNMSRIINKLSKVSEGDLTVAMKTSGNTEFGRLAFHVMESVSNTRRLIEEVVSVSERVKESVTQVNHITQDLVNASQGIQVATGDIDSGLNQQSKDAEDCLIKMDSLSNRIMETDGHIAEMENSARRAEDMAQKSGVIMKELSKQSENIEENSEQLSNKILLLDRSSREIQEFVNTIQEIAEQTNLLALNASIEAARAGEAGKGFGVVASEIKNLANNSLAASEKVKEVVEHILTMTQDTVESANHTKQGIGQQKEVVDQTDVVFTDISTSVSHVADNLSMVNEQMKKMNEDRNATFGAVESISSVMEETAASSTMVKEAVDRQLEQVTMLREITEELDNLSEKMQSVISQFVI